MTKTLSPELAALLRTKVEDSGNKINEQYSGRAMYGRNCFGITIRQHSSMDVLRLMIELMAELFREGEADLMMEIEELDWKMSQDNMGKDMIYYFKNIQWPKEEEPEEDEDESWTDKEDYPPAIPFKKEGE